MIFVKESRGNILKIYWDTLSQYAFFSVYLKTSSQFTILEAFSILHFIPVPLYALLLIFRIGIWSSPSHRETCEFLEIPVSRPWWEGTGVFFLDLNNLVRFCLGQWRRLDLGQSFFDNKIWVTMPCFAWKIICQTQCPSVASQHTWHCGSELLQLSGSSGSPEASAKSRWDVPEAVIPNSAIQWEENGSPSFLPTTLRWPSES